MASPASIGGHPIHPMIIPARLRGKFLSTHYGRYALGERRLYDSFWAIRAGVILITISGYLGGELVFRHGMAVNAEPKAET